MLLVAGCAHPNLVSIPMPIYSRSVRRCRMGISTSATRWPKTLARRRAKSGQVAGSTAAGGALLSELFVDGSDEFVKVEGLFEDAASTEEFGYVEEVLIPLRAGHGDDLRVEILPRQL